MTTHTPWRHLQIDPSGGEYASSHPDYPENAGSSYEHPYDAILDARGNLVCDNAGYYAQPITREHAALIVHRVNGWDEQQAKIDELVGVVQDFVNGADTNAITSEQDETFANLLHNARIALTRAKGE